MAARAGVLNFWNFLFYGPKMATRALLLIVPSRVLKKHNIMWRLGVKGDG